MLKKIAIMMSLILMTAICCVNTAIASGPVEFYVAPDGSNDNPGTNDKPLKTLQAARDLIRRMDQVSKSKGVNVLIKDGTYMLDKTLDLDSRDSGTKDGPISYRAAKGAKVTVMGGKTLPASKFTPVKNPSIIERLDRSVRGKVLQCDLRKLDAVGNIQTDSMVTNELINGAMFSNRMPVPELFFKNEPLPFSKWPNEGFATYGKVIDKGSIPRWAEKPERPGTFEYTGNRPERWRKAKHIFVHGYFCFDWFDDVLKVAKLDTAKKQITFTEPHMYGLAKNKRYRVLGLLEEIDQPGEWMIDQDTGILYLYPPEDISNGQYKLSVLETPIIRMSGTEHVNFEGMTLEVTRGAGVDIIGGTDNQVVGCTLRNIGGAGILIRPAGYKLRDAGGLHQFPNETGDPLKDGRRNGVISCDLYNIGTTGISMIGGCRKTLDPAEHYAVNNDIFRYARRQRANQPAINMNGVGQRAAHNYIHDAPHVGLDYSGNDHIIEYNELTRLCKETGDVGAIYSGRNWTYRGNIVRYNYLHNIKGPGHLGSMALYLDDTHSSTYILGNIFYKVQRALLLGGGRDNIVENNIFFDAEYTIQLDNRSESWAHKYQKRGGDHRMYAKLEEVNHDKPPYSIRYPKLAVILENDPHKPSGNKVLNNVSFGGVWLGGGATDQIEFGDNLVKKEFVGSFDTAIADLILKENAELSQKVPGFKPVPFDKMGLYIDAWRRQLPGRKDFADAN